MEPQSFKLHFHQLWSIKRCTRAKLQTKDQEFLVVLSSTQENPEKAADYPGKSNVWMLEFSSQDILWSFNGSWQKGSSSVKQTSCQPKTRSWWVLGLFKHESGRRIWGTCLSLSQTHLRVLWGKRGGTNISHCSLLCNTATIFYRERLKTNLKNEANLKEVQNDQKV